MGLNWSSSCLFNKLPKPLNLIEYEIWLMRETECYENRINFIEKEVNFIAEFLRLLGVKFYVGK